MIEPDHDLAMELLTVVNKHSNRLQTASQFGSLIAVARAILHNPDVPVPLSDGSRRLIVGMAARALDAKSEKPDPVEEMLRRTRR